MNNFILAKAKAMKGEGDLQSKVQKVYRDLYEEDSNTLNEILLNTSLPSIVFEVISFTSKTMFCLVSVVLGGGEGRLLPIIISAS